MSEDMSDLPSNTTNEILRQDYPVLADDPNTIIICAELPMDEALGENKSST